MKFNLPAEVKKAILEGLRVTLLGIVSYLLTDGVIATIVNTYLSIHLDATLTIIITGLITSALRSLDKWLHERGKENGNTGFLGQKGITGF